DHAAQTPPPNCVSAGAEVVPCAKSSRPWVLSATILGSSLAFIDGTVVNVALPALQKDLTATVLDVQWVVEAYLLLLSALLLVGGSLGDRFGRRKIYQLGIAIFALSSAWCGFAPNIAQLIAARAVQGLGAALLVPGSLAIIGSAFPENERAAPSARGPRSAPSPPRSGRFSAAGWCKQFPGALFSSSTCQSRSS
ncbi:MAG: MFS transporter, partial [Verrucomicrobiota bacterium]|nr:MFS transporter [Verrucomicrobiota bacterium]